MVAAFKTKSPTELKVVCWSGYIAVVVRSLLVVSNGVLVVLGSRMVVLLVTSEARVVTSNTVDCKAVVVGSVELKVVVGGVAVVVVVVVGGADQTKGSTTSLSNDGR